MMTGQQIKDEKHRIEEEKRRIEVEKRRIEEEKHRIEVEKLKIEHKKCSIEREKRKIEDEKRRIEDEKCRIEDEKRRLASVETLDDGMRAAMKELIKTAKIYYNSCSSAVKDAAKKFFEDIDHDKDGKVSLHEFLEFMEQEGHKKMSSRNFFETLVRKGSGTLNFTEVLAIFYIIQSGRPFCRRCNVFIAGMYFTCSECHESDSYDVIFLCPDCFENGSHTHRHGRRQFLDNYALLALKRKQRIDRAARHSKQVIEQ
ncbi:hypothetical protein RHSIM_RhsimUnG0195300 [Rhododendron simsii]|uniref:EF-hand domain-containing protein n=1 Tax=Rhododendron simsii TaxID=118357 RepID=A0A834FUV9_RHOSS|nr:hypothetical protein RHSIM_RhsimUnG0195300 [Rhododendron simsii]